MQPVKQTQHREGRRLVTIGLVPRHPCGPCLAEEGAAQTYARGARLCTLPDFDRRQWIPSDAPAYAEPHGDERDPVERHLAAGCPGGWYRSPFVSSLDPYRPVYLGGSVLPARKPASSALILEALQVLDHYSGTIDREIARLQ